MNKFGNVFFTVFAVNLVVFGLGFATFDFFVALLFFIPIEFFVGLLFVFFKDHRDTGAALIAASGVSLLVAGFVCSNGLFK